MSCLTNCPALTFVGSLRKDSIKSTLCDVTQRCVPPWRRVATRGLCTTLIKELDQVPEKSTVIFGLASHLESKLNKQCVLSSSTLNWNSFSRLIDPQWERGGPDAEGPARLGDCSPSRRVGVFSQEGPGGAKAQPKQQPGRAALCLL